MCLSPTLIDVGFGWQHEFLDGDDVEAAFAAGGLPFTIDPGSRDSNAVYLGVGVSHLLNITTAVYIRYEGWYGDDSDVNTLSGGFSIRF